MAGREEKRGSAGRQQTCQVEGLAGGERHWLEQPACY